MKIETLGRFKRVTIAPGEFYASDEAVTISTLLGSCVAACLYDPVNKIVGMNHFLLSNRRYARDMPMYATEAGRYGIHAMELLIDEMMRLGAVRRYLKAKAFGGAKILPHTGEVGNFFCVNEVNCRFIREFLASENIPLLAEDLGGERGKVIHFSNGDYAVYMRKIGGTRSERLAIRDRSCWLKAIEAQEQTFPSADIWL
ncbi:MAG: chemotaxis protein [Geobacteraceae bacterium]|nr:MAG: chemotaxis protein [Geobacteraceae bacterium]